MYEVFWKQDLYVGIGGNFSFQLVCIGKYRNNKCGCIIANIDYMKLTIRQLYLGKRVSKQVGQNHF